MKLKCVEHHRVIVTKTYDLEEDFAEELVEDFGSTEKFEALIEAGDSDAVSWLKERCEADEEDENWVSANDGSLEADWKVIK
jgi:hypothetical protein